MWKNGWQLAEVNGDATPYGVQHVLGRAMWDAEAVRKDVRAYVVEHLGDPHAVLVIDGLLPISQLDLPEGICYTHSPHGKSPASRGWGGRCGKTADFVGDKKLCPVYSTLYDRSTRPRKLCVPLFTPPDLQGEPSMWSVAMRHEWSASAAPCVARSDDRECHRGVERRMDGNA